MSEDTRSPNLDARLEAEIEAALGDISVEDMLDYADRPQAARGERDTRTGTVVNVHGGMVYVEFGPKAQGICPLVQFESAPEPGARLEFVVDRFDQREELLILSREGVVQKADWESLGVGQVVEARCTGVNKGGLELEIAHHRAFMPASHVDLRHIEDLNVFVGEKMPCEIIDLDRSRNRIVVSRRLPLEAERARMRDKLLDVLKVGATVPAVITSIQPYGAFADIGGVDGLIHVSDLSHQRVSHPSEVVKAGDHVNVKVLKIERESEKGGPRIGLGLKQCMEDPFARAAQALEPGAIVSGRVTRLAPFGAFVELEPGVEGLVHISELSHDRVPSVDSVVRPDQIVNVKILAVEHAQRRISLSLKAARAETGEAAPSRKEDPEVRRLKALLGGKFGGNLKGGLGLLALSTVALASAAGAGATAGNPAAHPPPREVVPGDPGQEAGCAGGRPEKWGATSLAGVGIDAGGGPIHPLIAWGPC